MLIFCWSYFHASVNACIHIKTYNLTQMKLYQSYCFCCAYLLKKVLSISFFSALPYWLITPCPQPLPFLPPCQFSQPVASFHFFTHDYISNYQHTHTHTHSGILLSHKKEWKNAICSNMGGLIDYHTKWSKSDKDKYLMIRRI